MFCNFDWYAPLSNICEGCALTVELGYRYPFPQFCPSFSVGDLRLKGEWEIRRYDHPRRTAGFGECEQNCESREENLSCDTGTLWCDVCCGK